METKKATLGEPVLRNRRSIRRRKSSPSEIIEKIAECCPNGDRVDLCRSLSFKSDGSQSYSPADIEIKELLGKGCFGEVYKVVTRSTGVTLVMKCLYRMDKKCEEDFLREAAFLRQLCHPNIVAFHGVLYKEKKLHILTEYIPGGSLRSCLDSPSVRLDWLQSVSIAKDISAGMAYLHGKNIIHRDLTSGNILLRWNEADAVSAVVADFGLAAMIHRRSRVGRKRRLTVVGNPYMMAPEMMNEKTYDERADVFSYGITLCETIGRCTVDPDDLPRTKNFGVDKEAFLKKICSRDCPAPFYEIALKCASVDPEERPPFRIVNEWLVVLQNACREQDDSLFEIFVHEILHFTPDANLSGSDVCDTSTPNRPFSSLGRLSIHRRKIPLDSESSSCSLSTPENRLTM